ncbi:MAG: DUF1553 domain-containing protein [Verrucomicrobia bacterium]|nr:DUF1553 domain-containing protein [Verrucomicrobiota bacterium]
MEINSSPTATDTMRSPRIFWIALLAVGPASAEPPGHWAFQPIKNVHPPSDPQGWSVNPIDRFVIAKLQEKGLAPVSSADKQTLIRRVYFDLIGLPPSPEEVAAFLADASPDAYAQLVERVLASPRYGERWGRHWMDVVRYADTAGDNADYPIPEIHLYRDYIIDSFNADKPYDQFVREQLAGDILAKQGPPEKYAERVVATGFLALSRRYATAPFELWHLTLEDTIETTGRAFLGLTLRCARCHDHKYDPVTKEDYYALYGIFDSTRFPYAGSEEFQSKNFPRSGFLALSPPMDSALRLNAYEQSLQKLESEIKRAETESELAKQIARLKERIEAKQKQIRDLESVAGSAEEVRAELASLEQSREQINKQLQEKLKPLQAELRKRKRPGAPTDLPVAYAACEGKAADAFLQMRGNPDDKGPRIKRGPPKVLAASAPFFIPEGSSGRLELAQWLTSPENPLTARVMVNRIWQHHFGKGIVATPSNFGLRGDEPTHPDLLDDLARRFLESGWSVKAMHRLIMTSETYQLASAHAEDNGRRDPDNKLYWRFDRRRLDAESIRDATLAVAGQLNLKRPQPHPFPSMETWTFTQHSPFKAIYESNHRSVYLMTQRIQRHPFLALFDGPDPNTTTDTRTESTVALQALFMMNNQFVQEQAAAFARRLLESAQEDCERIRQAHELAWSRLPQPTEVEKAVGYLQRYKNELARTASPEASRDLDAWTSYARILLTANEFVYVD